MATGGKRSSRARLPAAGCGVWALGCLTLLLMLALSSLLWLELGVWVLLLAIVGVALLAILSVARKRPE